MQADKFVVLIRRLILANKENKLDWKQTPRKDEFSVSFPSYSVTLEYDDEFSPRNAIISLAISNEEGELIERIYPSQLDNGGMIDAASVMMTLFESARRKAMGVDKAVEVILSELTPANDENVVDEVPF